MERRTRFGGLDYAPAIALLGFWGVGGLASAITVAQAEGGLRHLVLGVVTLPSLVLIARAVGRVRCTGRRETRLP